MTDEIDLEREKTESYRLGQLSRLDELAVELRERAGDQWAKASSPRESGKARQLKDLAEELEERYEHERARWEEEYKDG